MDCKIHEALIFVRKKQCASVDFIYVYPIYTFYTTLAHISINTINYSHTRTPFVFVTWDYTRAPVSQWILIACIIARRAMRASLASRCVHAHVYIYIYIYIYNIYTVIKLMEIVSFYKTRAVNWSTNNIWISTEREGRYTRIDVNHAAFNYWKFWNENWKFRRRSIREIYLAV